MLEAGAVGFKAFLGPTTGNIPPPGDGSMYEALEKSSRLGFTIAFHGENWGLVRRFTERVKSEGRADPLAHLCSRPPVCEEEAAQRIALYARRTGGGALRSGGEPGIETSLWSSSSTLGMAFRSSRGSL